MRSARTADSVSSFGPLKPVRTMTGARMQTDTPMSTPMPTSTVRDVLKYFCMSTIRPFGMSSAMYFTRLALIPRLRRLNANRNVIKRLSAPYCVAPSLRVMYGVEKRVNAAMNTWPAMLEIVFCSSRLPVLWPATGRRSTRSVMAPSDDTVLSCIVLSVLNSCG